jgi:hypothetical protein
MRFSRQLENSLGNSNYWSQLPCPPSGDFPDPGIELMSLKSPALADQFFTTSATWKAFVNRCFEITMNFA